MSLVPYGNKGWYYPRYGVGSGVKRYYGGRWGRYGYPNTGLSATFRRPYMKAFRPASRYVNKVTQRPAGKLATETKFYDYTSNEANVTLSNTRHLLAQVAQGDNENERIGLRIWAKSLEVKGYFILDPAVIPSTVAQLDVFVDTATTATAPSMSDLFVSPSALAMRTGRSVDMARFRFLKSVIIDLDERATRKSFSFWIPLRFQIDFLGTSATSRGTNQVYLVARGVGPTTSLAMLVDTRLRYQDR